MSDIQKIKNITLYRRKRPRGFIHEKNESGYIPKTSFLYIIWKTISVHIWKISGLSKFNYSGGDPENQENQENQEYPENQGNQEYSGFS